MIPNIRDQLPVIIVKDRNLNNKSFMEEDNIRILTLLADSIRIRIKTSLKNQS
jgi:hypothetical protein